MYLRILCLDGGRFDSRNAGSEVEVALGSQPQSRAATAHHSPPEIWNGYAGRASLKSFCVAVPGSIQETYFQETTLEDKTSSKMALVGRLARHEV
jgi:hypothetical protein